MITNPPNPQFLLKKKLAPTLNFELVSAGATIEYYALQSKRI